MTATSVPAAPAGFVVVGPGLANVFPLAISRAGVLGGARGIALALSVAGDALRAPVPPRGLVAVVAPRVQPLVSRLGHGTAVYVRELRALDPSP